MSDQTPDPTAWSDGQLDDLLDALAERAAERDDLDLPGSGASRRGVLAGLLGLGGAAAGAGVASAIGENESYGSSTGITGTDSEPLNEANVQDLHAQEVQVDNLLETKQVTFAEGYQIEEAANSPLQGSGSQSHTISINSNPDIAILDIKNFRNTSGSQQDLQLRINGNAGGYFGRRTDNTTFSNLSQLPISNGEGNGGELGARVTLHVPPGVDSGVNVTGPTGLGTSAGVLNAVSANDANLNSITLRGSSGTVEVDARVRLVSI